MNDVLFQLLNKESDRQSRGINLIASENYAPPAVREMVGSVLMNKYVEGYPGSRYYSGCEIIDQIEMETISRFKSLFKAEHVNVQPHSGSQANMAVYLALLKPADTILSMKLSDGGHLTHGLSVNFSGKLYNVVHYGLCPKTELIDYDQLAALAKLHKPKLIIAGASSYSRQIDFEKISHIAKDVGAYFLADIAHIAGLVAAGLHPTPVGHADVVTMTTHKTFNGPRGGVILSRSSLANSIDRAVMPGVQGGAFAHEIAAKGVACELAMQPDFVVYQKHIVNCARTMAQQFVDLGHRVISGGTDTHLFLIDVRPCNLTGKQAEQLLESIDIFVNRNAIPQDSLPPLQAGGIRIGTSAIASRGASLQNCLDIVKIIHEALKSNQHQIKIEALKHKVKNTTNSWK